MIRVRRVYEEPGPEGRARFLSDLRMEIADTEDYALRQALHWDELTLKALIARLDEADDRPTSEQEAA